MNLRGRVRDLHARPTLWEVAVIKSKRVLRRAILVRLYDHLQDAYELDCPRESFVSGQLALREIDALLAFKSDPRIDELRGALDRLEQGVFGVCIACKREIDSELLEVDPAMRLCEQCERLYNHMHLLTPHSTQSRQSL
jgi:RNA polymerase-binding transcription factor DksA